MQALLRWYDAHGRDLPWRRDPDPYRVWVSEIMLQQTTVAVAGEYFERFVGRFPTMKALASAGEEDVLALWSGLGYYHRARNMLEAARIMMREHSGRVPRDPDELRALPGIGPYTAGAILSIGYNIAAHALDGNIMRVMARFAGIAEDPAKAATRRQIEREVMRLMPVGEAGRFTQALMDLGATICTPRDPSCLICPMAARCAARRLGLTGTIPPMRRRAQAVDVEMVCLAVIRKDECLLVRREGGPVMRGMWEFPLTGAPAPESASKKAQWLARSLGAKVSGRAGSVRHTITNHRININVYAAAPTMNGWRPRGSRAACPLGKREVSEPASRLATGGGSTRRIQWARLADLAGRTDGLALTSAARKIARLLCAESRA